MPLDKNKGSKKHRIQDKIVIIEALVFALPFLAFLCIIYQGNYHFDTSQIIMFMVIAVSILVGMIILRQILDRVSMIAMSLKTAESSSAIPIEVHKDVVELHEISVSLNNLLQKLGKTSEELGQRTFELSIIRDVSQIIKTDLSFDDQLNLLLEKCLAVTDAQIGSVFIVEPETRQKNIALIKSQPIPVSELYRFRVCAAIGHGEELKKGALLNIEKSIIKTALLEKGPLLIVDISEDPRTQKTNDPKYGPPSFLCMPIIVGGTVWAILNLARKKKELLFDENDEKILSIILTDMGFALENALLQSRIKEQLEKIKGHHLELEREIEKRNRIERTSKHVE
jgi:two-component system, cell cycle sensor histidine kinase and response regulator CckA